MLQKNYRFTRQEFLGSLTIDSMFVTEFIGILSLVTNIALGFMVGLVLALTLNQIVHLQQGITS